MTLLERVFYGNLPYCEASYRRLMYNATAHGAVMGLHAGLKDEAARAEAGFNKEDQSYYATLARAWR